MYPALSTSHKDVDSQAMIRVAATPVKGAGSLVKDGSLARNGSLVRDDSAVTFGCQVGGGRQNDFHRLPTTSDLCEWCQVFGTW